MPPNRKGASDELLLSLGLRLDNRSCAGALLVSKYSTPDAGAALRSGGHPAVLTPGSRTWGSHQPGSAHFDLDAELKIWISGTHEPIEKTFTKGVDIYEVQAILTQFVAR